jgi:hypothetical protein
MVHIHGRSVGAVALRKMRPIYCFPIVFSKLFGQPSKIENTAVLSQFTDSGEDAWPK